MKSLLLAGAALVLTAGAASAADHHEMSAEMKEWVASCEAAKSEESKTDCKCLYKKAAADEQVKSDLDAYESMETVGEAGKEAIMACQMHDDMKEGDH